MGADVSPDRAAIEAAARDLGVVPGDPAYPFVRFMMGMVDDLAHQQEAAGNRLDQVIQEAKTVAGGEIARNAARELPNAIKAATFQQHRTSFMVAAVVLVGSVVAAGCSGFLWGQHTEAQKFVQIPAEFRTAMTGPEAALWLNLMRLNDIAASQHSCGPQKGGEACNYAFWTRRPPVNTN